MTDLKTVLTGALHSSLIDDQDTVFGWNLHNVVTVLSDDVISIRPNDAESDIYNVDFNAKTLAKMVTGHFLDREKVRAALIAAIMEEFSVFECDGPGDDTHEFPTQGGSEYTGFNINPMVDRLIEGLAAGGSEG